MYALDLHIPALSREHDGWCLRCGMPCRYQQEYHAAEIEVVEAWGQPAVIHHPDAVVTVSRCCEGDVSDTYTDAVADIHADHGRVCVRCGGIAGYDFAAPMVYANYAESLPRRRRDLYFAGGDGRCLACAREYEQEADQ